MMNRNRIVGLAVGLLLAGTLLYHNGSREEQEAALPAEAAPRLNTAAPSFQLTALDGATYQVGGPRDKPLLLNFWASWCDPCEEEAPALASLYDKYKDKLDLYAVNLTGNDDFERMKAFAARFKFHFPVLLDYKLEAAQKYRFQAIPTSFLIDKNGNITDVINLLTPEELEKKLQKLIGM
ncbi:TlpA disulfide reductase family protein [Paenibacillus sp. YN15]|uniref:TlpA family protein disulfide reductase n=1 Tax=Paenibacillus sp. YN15 TaxID=1742774 RepID=UPI00215C288D|nr:TlpA disulfide reductase family protein [Paenibacillus sp. YN15]